MFTTLRTDTRHLVALPSPAPDLTEEETDAALRRIAAFTAPRPPQPVQAIRPFRAAP